MQTFLASLAIAAAIVGGSALATPAPEFRNIHPNCNPYCGAPEPDGCTGPCEYWYPCGRNCGCRKLPNCTP